MKKYIIISLTVIFLFSSATFTHASLTTTQVNAIIGLLQAFGADQNVVDNVHVALTGGTPTTTTSPPSCTRVDLKYNLYLGVTDNETGSEVTKLQKFLAQDTDVYPAGLITGFFGPMTERAVQKWQAKNSIVSSGAPDTTGYGVVGPKTRDKIIGICGETSLVSPTTTPRTQEGVATSTTTSSIATTTLSDTTPAVPSIPVIPAIPTTPSSGGGATPATTTPPVDPTPPEDTMGPLITSLLISPTNIESGELVTFTATIEDDSGIENVIYDIHYPNSSYILRLNCHFEGVNSGTCTFTESIDHGISPTLYGEYVIESIRVTDSLGNLATYYPNDSVSGGSQNTHNLSIPTIFINEPQTFILEDNFDSYENGSIAGQNAWESYVNGSNFIVQIATTYSGTKALYNNTQADSVVTKKGEALSDGKQSFYIRTENRDEWSEYADGNAQVRVTKNSWAGGAPNLPFVAVSFKKDGNVAFYDTENDVYQNFANYDDNTWVLLEIEWRSSDVTARYRVDSGSWTNWYAFQDNDNFTNFDYVGFDFVSNGGSGGVYIDHIH